MTLHVRKASFGAVMLLLATLVGMPGVSAAAAPGATTSSHQGSGSLRWSADHVTYLYSGGARYAARGHGYIGEDDCWGWGMDGMRITVLFQRFVGGHWTTTQTQSKHIGWSNGGWMMMDDHHARSFSPTFQLRHADMGHRTRMRFSFGWYDHDQVLASHMAVRYPH